MISFSYSYGLWGECRLAISVCSEEFLAFWVWYVVCLKWRLDDEGASRLRNHLDHQINCPAHAALGFGGVTGGISQAAALTFDFGG